MELNLYMRGSRLTDWFDFVETPASSIVTWRRCPKHRGKKLKHYPRSDGVNVPVNDWHRRKQNIVWAATWQNHQNGYAPSENSDQPGHAPSLTGAFAVRMKKAWFRSYPLSAQRRLRSDAQADLSLRWAHSHFVGFVMSRLVCYCIIIRQGFRSFSDVLQQNPLTLFTINDTRNFLKQDMGRSFWIPRKLICLCNIMASVLSSDTTYIHKHGHHGNSSVWNWPLQIPTHIVKRGVWGCKVKIINNVCNCGFQE